MHYKLLTENRLSRNKMWCDNYNRGFSCDVRSKNVCQVILPPAAMLVSFPYGRVTFFYLFHTTLPNFNRVIGISAHTVGWNYKSFHKVNWKFMYVLLFFPYRPVKKETKRAYKIFRAYVITASCKPCITCVTNERLNL